MHFICRDSCVSLRGEAVLLLPKGSSEGLDDAMQEGRCGHAELADLAAVAKLVPRCVRARMCKRARRLGSGLVHGV